MRHDIQHISAYLLDQNIHYIYTQQLEVKNYVNTHWTVSEWKYATHEWDKMRQKFAYRINTRTLILVSSWLVMTRLIPAGY